MTSPFAIANYIARKVPAVMSDAKKLQKLLYYTQAWSLVWNGKPAFVERIEAWTKGPVVPKVYREQTYGAWRREGPVELEPEVAAVADAVIQAYGDKPGSWLSELAHREWPWIEARQGLPADAKGNEVITHESMRRWYSQAQLKKHRFPEAYLRGLEILVDTPEDELHELFSREGSIPGNAYVAWLEAGDSKCDTDS